MLNLARNQSKVFYKLYQGQASIKDENGYYSSQSTAQYGELQSAMLCVSAAKGPVSWDAFGTLADYDRTLTTSDCSCPIDELSILWLDGADSTGPHNYVVTRKAVWKNSVLYAVKQVTVSNG